MNLVFSSNAVAFRVILAEMGNFETISMQGDLVNALMVQCAFTMILKKSEFEVSSE